ncbi:MAG: hypothetical protein ACI9QR_000653, partial [Flavobacteriaceae bacterium]
MNNIKKDPSPAPSKGGFSGGMSPSHSTTNSEEIQK